MPPVNTGALDEIATTVLFEAIGTPWSEWPAETPLPSIALFSRVKWATAGGHWAEGQVVGVTYISEEASGRLLKPAGWRMHVCRDRLPSDAMTSLMAMETLPESWLIPV